MIKVYFAGAIRGDRIVADTIKYLIDYIKINLQIPVLSEHVGSENPVEEFARKIKKSIDDLLAEDIETQDIQWLDQSTHVIAEISGASTGTGREIEYARTKDHFGKIPAKILVLYHREREYSASPMIRGMKSEKYPNVTVKNYDTLDEAKDIVKDFLR